jgi:hypothetical protein
MMASLSSKELKQQPVYQAMDNWNTYSAQTIQALGVVMEAITPLKDAAQVAEQTAQLMSTVDWQSASQKTLDVYSIWDAYCELFTIQTAGVNLLLQDQSQALKSGLDSSVEWIESVKTNPAQPEEAMASSINASIALLKQCQDNLNNQVQHITAIQSAYMAWLQKSVFQPWS